MLINWLRKGNVVVADRYVRSNQAHQGARKKGSERKRIIEHFKSLEFGLYGLPQPDLNIFLDLPVDFSLEAMRNQRRATDVNEENIRYQNEVRKVFRALHSEPPTASNLIIPCIKKSGERRGRQEIADRVWNAVDERVLSRL